MPEKLKALELFFGLLEQEPKGKVGPRSNTAP